MKARTEERRTARIIVWLFIESGSLSVEEMSTQIGLTPDQSWEIGDPRGRTGKSYQTNSWCLEEKLEDVEDNPSVVGESLVVCLNEVLDRIESHWRAFRNVSASCSSGLYIGVSASDAPVLRLEAAMLTRISALGVDLEIDVML